MRVLSRIKLSTNLCLEACSLIIYESIYRFHAYFPAGNSFPSILADMLSGAIGCVGFSWVSYKNTAKIWRRNQIFFRLQLLHALNLKQSFWIGSEKQSVVFFTIIFSCITLTLMILMIGLPPQFLSRTPNSRGGGVIQTSASECVLDCLLAARCALINNIFILNGPVNYLYS